MSSPDTMPVLHRAEGSLEETIRQILTEEVGAGAAASAVAVVDLGGRTIGPIAVGSAVAFGADGAALSAGQHVPARTDTVYDLASVSKVVSTVAVLSLVGDGLLALDQPVGSRLPAFARGERSTITLRHLLTHTAGLPGTWEGWRTLPSGSGRARLLEDLLGVPLTTPPGTAFAYSCVGYNTAMALAEAVTGQRWVDIVEERVLGPLRELDPRTAPLTYAPRPEECAATEYQPELGRGMVRGTVHDETAWMLGGGAANAGLFGTAEAVLGLGTVLRDTPERLLPLPLADQLWTDQLPGLLAPERAAEAGFGHGLGLRIGQVEWMGASGGAARGHNGFTGPSLLMDRTRSVTVVLLANRVHPSRIPNTMGPFRSRLADAVCAWADADQKAAQ